MRRERKKGARLGSIKPTKIYNLRIQGDSSRVKSEWVTYTLLQKLCIRLRKTASTLSKNTSSDGEEHI